MRVAGDDDVVADVVLGEVAERAVAVGLVAVPSVVVEWVDIAVCERLVDAGEDGLRSDDPPAGATFSRGGELVVEPALTISKVLSVYIVCELHTNSLDESPSRSAQHRC